MTHTLTTTSLEETANLGQRLGALLYPGAVVALVGPLGAGKTHLVRAIAEGMNVADLSEVCSPTYTLIHEYAARLPIYHFDAYRLASPAAFADLGVDEYFAAGGVCLVEWADRVAVCLPAERLEVTISPTGSTSRQYDFLATDEASKELLTRLTVPGSAC